MAKAAVKKKPAPARGRPPAKKAATPRTTRAKRQTPSARAFLAEHLGNQADEIWGVLLVVAGVLAALGIYADLTGPVGRMIRDGAGGALGAGRFLVPPALAAVGVSMLLGHRRHEPGRVSIGASVAVVAATGLAHLAGENGGAVGMALGEPLQRALAVWGASLVLGTVFLLAVLILTKTTVRTALAAITAGARGLGSVIPAKDLEARGGEELQAARRHPSARRQRPADEPPAEQVTLIAPDDEPLDVILPEPVLHVPEPPEPEPEPPETEQLSIELGPAGKKTSWRLPPLQLLTRSAAQQVDKRMLEAEGRALEDALAAHGVVTHLVGMTTGPTVTRYELELGDGVKVAKVTSLHKDIAYAMAAADVIIRAPIPGRKAIGVEVPNKRRVTVTIGDVLSSAEARKASHPLEVSLGSDIANRPVLVNLAEMPHLLIAGATGAGKSSCINSLITSILIRSTPDQVRLILIDPKRVELGQYNNLPHLLTQVVVNPKKAANALAWTVTEMERRYDLLAEVGVRDITGYNGAFDRGELKASPGEGSQALAGSDREYERLPFIVVVVDELNDLMMVAARDVEESICRIAQMARAVGIHLVIATQRPSVDVITGVIKANIPSRLAFGVSSLADSRVILDQPGAERLIGQGDMLLLTASSSVARRIQGSWVSEDEVRKVVAHWRRQGQANYVKGVEGEDHQAGMPGGVSGEESDDDELLRAAMDLIVRSQLGSTSMLQRKLKVGFARAGRLMDLLEQRGIVGPSEGSKARSVLMTVDELDALQRSAE